MTPNASPPPPGSAARRPAIDAVPAPLLVLGGILSVQVGAAMAAGLIAEIGAVATVGLRLAVAALVLLLVARPEVRGKGRRDWLPVLALGVTFAAMNLCFYGALSRIPLGIVVTIEFLGPLGLAAFHSRTPVHLLAVVIAFAGVVAVSGALEGGLATVDVIGLLLTAGASVGWVAYILEMKVVGARWRQLDGLALSMAIGAVLVTPLGLASASAPVTAAILTIGVVIGVMSSAVPYSLELIALRRLDTRVFGVLLSLEPAVAATAGLLLLGQRLSAVEVVGIALVVTASILVMRDQEPEPGTQLAEVA